MALQIVALEEAQAARATVEVLQVCLDPVTCYPSQLLFCPGTDDVWLADGLVLVYGRLP